LVGVVLLALVLRRRGHAHRVAAAVDEAAALDDQALGALRGMDMASAPPPPAPVAPPTDAVDEVAAWFAPELVDRLKGAMVRVQPAGR
jgi:hypothetical protein